jgi:uncharacterized protein with PIN domain/tRNA(Ser,Leu) C12 N-acetylase TAN1
VTYLVRLSEPGRDGQRGKERRALAAQLRARLPAASVQEGPGRLVVECAGAADEELARLHGVVSFSRCCACRLDELERRVVELACATVPPGGSYRLRVRRVGAHAFTSSQKAAELGHAVGVATGARVDLEHPDVVIGVEIRASTCYVFDAVEPGLDHRPRPTPPGAVPPRFLVDQMLGRLRTWLRVLGIDAAGTHDEADGEILARAVAEGRIILTRDRALAGVPGVPVHFVAATRAAEQVREVVATFALRVGRAELLSRCTFCNVRVEPIASPERVPAIVARRYDRFFRCPRCARVYWPGEQYQRIVQAVGDLIRDEPSAS